MTDCARHWILKTPDYYTCLTRWITSIGFPWNARDSNAWDRHRQTKREMLDCTCG